MAREGNQKTADVTYPVAADNFDFIVIGAGVSGLAAAGRGAEHGARVLVLEKSSVVGGSAVLSGGILWSAPDIETLHRIQPDGDPNRGRILVEEYDDIVEDLVKTGIAVSDSWDRHFGWGRARKIDVDGLFAVWTDRIRATRGTILTDVSDVMLDVENGTVVGVSFRQGGRQSQARGAVTVLATGGFQGDPQLVEQFIGSGASDILVRSNPCSVGDGFRLAQTVGAGTSRHLSSFYGHLFPSPLEDFGPKYFGVLVQYHSQHAILVNRRGRRFTDETLGDEVSNQRLVRQPDQRGVLLWDTAVQDAHVNTAAYPTAAHVARFDEARRAGARTARTMTLGALISEIAKWGVDPVAVTATLRNYQSAASGHPVALDAPVSGTPNPLDVAPFYAVEVQPTITVPFGGIRVDQDGRVLTRDNRIISGLFAVGFDAGGLQDLRWSGGISVGLIFGRRAADVIVNVA
jgi:succinate dehydrogenase/fumarate reductase flavoprotein subunit